MDVHLWGGATATWALRVRCGVVSLRRGSRRAAAGAVAAAALAATPAATASFTAPVDLAAAQFGLGATSATDAAGTTTALITGSGAPKLLERPPGAGGTRKSPRRE